MIHDRLNEEMKSALKSADKLRLAVIRMLRAELGNAQLAMERPLTEEEESRILMAYAKKRKEAMEQARELGRPEHAKREEEEYRITMSFLPAPLGESEIVAIIEAKIREIGAQGPRDFGRVMKAVMQEVGSRAEGSAVSALVKKVLGG